MEKGYSRKDGREKFSKMILKKNAYTDKLFILYFSLIGIYQLVDLVYLFYKYGISKDPCFWAVATHHIAFLPNYWNLY
jgi:hypothetical protein